MPMSGVGTTRTHTYCISYDVGGRWHTLYLEMESFVLGYLNRLSDCNDSVKITEVVET